MEDHILVINRIGTLRRHTVQIIQNLGYKNISGFGHCREAQAKLADADKEVLIILELILVGMITMGGYLLLAHLFDIPVLRYFPSFIKRKTGED